MAGSPQPPPPTGPPDKQNLKYQRRILRDQYRYQIRSMRRRSIVGPIFLIVIGAVFLLVQTGRLSAEHLWSWYGHWWPLLLIAIGIILLAEWGMDQFQPSTPQQPYIRRSLGGGVLALIILLTLVGICVNRIRDGRNFLIHGLAINSDNFEEVFGSKHESDESRVEAIPSNAMLSIQNPRGNVTITGTSSDQQIHISVHRQVYSNSDSVAESKALYLTPQISNTGRLFSITLPSLRGAIADITMTIPSSVAVTVTANHGDVHLDSLNAPVTLNANHGDVVVSAIHGAVVAHVNNSASSFSAHDITGSLSVEGHNHDLILSEIRGAVTLSGDFYGTTRLEHVAGNIKFHTSRTEMQLARLNGAVEISPDADLSIDQALGPVVLTTRNRNIRLDKISGELSVSNRNGSVDVLSALPAGNITIQNLNGSVNLSVPDKTDFTVHAETNDGDIENDFSVPVEQTGNRKVLNGSIGKGGTLIRINTSHGDVSIKKAQHASDSSTLTHMP